MSTQHGLGVPQLDKLLEPIPERATLLILSDPTVESEPFLYQAANTALKDNRDVIYLVANRAPDEVGRSMAEFGFSPDKIHFIDAFSALMGAASGAAYVASKPNDLSEIVRLIEKAGRERPDALLVVDSLSTLIDHASPESFVHHASRFMHSLRGFAASVVLFTKWPYAESVLEELQSFDAAISLRAVEDRVVVSQYFSVDRAAWKRAFDGQPRLYKTVKPGGVLVYVPKIVVTGPFNAGKSTFVRSISDESVSVDHLGTTVALDHGRVTMDGLTADIFGTPGQARFDPILKIVANQAVGLVLVVDSTKPDSFPRARAMLEQTWKQGIPAIVAANKQDERDALSPDEVARVLDPPPNVRVMGCVSSDSESGKAVLRALIDQVLARSVPA